MYIVFYICFLALLSSCATIVPPSGGEKDTSPPEILSTLPLNRSINFKEDKIQINFNEYIQVDKPNIIFFPPINPTPSVKTQGKSVILNFETDLIDNTTYIINFNNSIKDINESNELNNFKFIFSTGSALDSCVVKGSVFDLKSNKKINSAIVGLFKKINYSNLDSLIRAQEPDYYVYCDQFGEYKFTNLKEGEYTLLAFKDLNFNKKYDKIEKISMPIKLNIDSIHNHDMRLFTDNRFLKIDTLDCENSLDKTNVGQLNFNFEKLDFNNKMLIGEILQKDKVISCFNINTKVVKIDSLSVGVYNFRIFHDLNNNGVWDSGNIQELSEPEYIKHYNQEIDIKKDWEIDVFVD